MADVQIAIIDQQNTQIALAAPPDTQVTAAVPGVQGPKGEGVPAGGTANQVLFKQSSTNYDTAWSAITSAMIGDLQIVDGDVSTTAAIAGTKISPNFGAQNVVTTGTSTAASFSPTSSSVPANGLYLPAANSVALSTGGTGRLFINSAGDIGIGWASPSYDLHLEKDENALTTSYFRNINTGSSAGSRLIAASLVGNLTFAAYSAAHSVWPATTVIGSDSGFTGGMVINAAGANPLRLFTDSTERLRITSDGKVGIGTTSPLFPLDVNGVIYTRGRGSTFGVLFDDWRIYNSTAPGALVFDNGTERLRITSAGLVGVGTSSPDVDFHVSNADTARIRLENRDATGSVAQSVGVIEFEGNDGGTGAAGVRANINAVYEGVDGATALAFGTAADGVSVSEKVRIDRNGRVGIGTTGPNYELHVNASDALSAIQLTNTSTGTTASDGFLIYNNGVNATISNEESGYLRFQTAGSERAQIDSSGRLLVGTATAETASLGALFQIQATGSSASALIKRNDNGALPSYLYLGKSRGTTVNSTTIVQDGDSLGAIRFTGADGSTEAGAIAAQITAAVDGTPGANDMPGRLVFSTTADGASFPTERLRITSAGLVGIGTSSPGGLLHVSGGRTLLSSSDGYELAFARTGNYFYWYNDGGNLSGKLSLTTSAGAGGGEIITFTQDTKRVGIGTTSPDVKLHVATGNATGYIKIDGGTSSSATTGLQFRADSNTYSAEISSYQGNLQFTTGVTERARIDSSGRFGIGTSSPGYTLDVNGTVNVVSGSNGRINIGATNNYLYGDSSGNIIIGTSGSDKIQITAAGNVGIGTTSPSYALDVSGQIRAAANATLAQLRLERTGSSTGHSWLGAQSDALLAVLDSSFAEKMRLDSSGRLLVGTSSQYSGISTQLLNTASAGAGAYAGLAITTYSASTGISSGSVITLDKSNSNTLGTNVAVTSGDQVGIIAFRGADGGSNFRDAAYIQCFVDGAVSGGGAADMPGRLVFSTTADGASSPSPRMTITSAGLVGIGTSSPGALFDVSGGGANGRFQVSPSAGVVFYNTLIGSGGYGSAINDATQHIWYVGGAEAARIDSSGRLGIGTTSPGDTLHVSGSIRADVDLKTINQGKLNLGSNQGGGAVLLYNTNGNLDIAPRSGFSTTFLASDGGTERARIDSSGRLLVGTSSGQGTALLQVEGSTTSSTNWGTLFLRRGQEIATIGANVGTALGQIDFGSRDGAVGATILAQSDATWSTAGSGDYPSRLVFSTTADGASSPTERMRITNAGLHYFMADGNDTTRLQNTAAAGTGTSFLAAYHSSTAGTVNTGTLSLNITTNGNITNTNGSYGTISDAKLKENIVDANSQWNDIKALKVRNYNFKEGQTHTQIGLIAQEVELVSPGLVSESPDRDAEGNDLGTVTKSVNLTVLYMKAVKALQEAMERIETLEQRLNDAGIN